MRVPSILDVQFDDPTLVISYIPGQVLLEELVKAGAFVRNCDQAAELTSHEKRERDLTAGREVLPRVVSMAFVSELARDLQRFHEAGSMIIDIKWGNIIIGTDGHPWWIDFHLTEDHPELSRESFHVLADLDIERFNRAFGTNLPTMNCGRRAG
jgi:tRNA A-37 threonylcarbamoyl transferase component Bud32